MTGWLRRLNPIWRRAQAFVIWGVLLFIAMLLGAIWFLKNENTQLTETIGTVNERLATIQAQNVQIQADLGVMSQTINRMAQDEREIELVREHIEAWIRERTGIVSNVSDDDWNDFFDELRSSDIRGSVRTD